MYSVSTKPQSQLQHIVSSNRCSNFGNSNLRNNCESACNYVVHLNYVMPIPGKTFHISCALVTNVTVKQ